MVGTYLPMIFNSISKQLSRNAYSKPTNYKSLPQEHYFPLKQPLFPPTNTQPTLPMDSNTALSKMNQKIADNLEYIRYKDTLRHSQLKSSRVSCSSNRSNRSNHSASKLTHTNSSKQSFPLPTAAVRFEDTPHYFPPASSLMTPNEKWRSQIKANHFERSPKYESEEFKQFTRKPITIESTHPAPSNLYSEHHRSSIQRSSLPERDFHEEMLRSKHSNKSSSFEEFRVEKVNSPFTPNHVEATPLSREWSNSFASHSQQPKTAQPIKIEEEQQGSKIAQAVAKPSMSPFPVEQKTKRDGIIVAAILIALGLMLLLLQILK